MALLSRPELNGSHDSLSSHRKQPQIIWLKLVMALGLALIILGHYLWVVVKLPQTMGVSGIILVAALSAVGLIMSLPTKIYLTLLLMEHERKLKEMQKVSTTTKHRE